ncbi:MAG: hypothetical protein Q9227_001220 [Pyrenula ochraceoflavens]
MSKVLDKLEAVLHCDTKPLPTKLQPQTSVKTHPPASPQSLAKIELPAEPLSLPSPQPSSMPQSPVMPNSSATYKSSMEPQFSVEPQTSAELRPPAEPQPLEDIQSPVDSQAPAERKSSADGQPSPHLQALVESTEKREARPHLEKDAGCPHPLPPRRIEGSHGLGSHPSAPLPEHVYTTNTPKREKDKTESYDQVTHSQKSTQKRPVHTIGPHHSDILNKLDPRYNFRL